MQEARRVVGAGRVWFDAAMMRCGFLFVIVGSAAMPLAAEAAGCATGWRAMKGTCERVREDVKNESCAAAMGDDGWTGAGARYTREVTERMTGGAVVQVAAGEWRLESADCVRKTGGEATDTCAGVEGWWTAAMCRMGWAEDGPLGTFLSR